MLLTDLHYYANNDLTNLSHKDAEIMINSLAGGVVSSLSDKRYNHAVSYDFTLSHFLYERHARN
jgi:hypothetical protein